MMSIESFVPDLIANLEAARDLLSDATVAACNEIANTAVEDLINNAPFDEEEDNMTPPDEEGHLNESFYAIEAIPGVGGEASAEVHTSQAIKLEYVTEGTEEKAPIRPLIKQALWWPALDHPVASVAGQEPNPFVEETYTQLLDKVDDIVRDIFLEIFEMVF
jgi:hypothetical protein